MSRTALPGSGLLERKTELGQIESTLASGRESHGSVLVIEGPPGIGKTALLRAARTSAEDAGMLVLRSRGAELERDFAFGVVRQLFEPSLAQVPATDRGDLLQGAAGMAASVLGLPGAEDNGFGVAAGPDPSFAVLHGLYWLSANFASRRPICLAVDDAHWADSPSLRFLAFMLPRLEDLPIAVIIATRPREAGADAGLIAALTADSSAEIVRLEPLTRDGVEEFVAAGLGAEPDAEFVTACRRATRGTPFLLRELVGALRADMVAPSAAAAATVGRIGARTIGRSISLRLARLPEAAGRLARALAILERGDLWQAARLAELEENEAATAADVLAIADIVQSGRPLTFVHPIVRTGIYGELTPGQRARGHRLAALLLAGQPGTNERVAEHLLASEPAADVWVVEHLVAAADTAARRGAPDSAAVFLRRALEEPPDAAARPGLLLALGMAEASAGLATWPVHLEAALSSATDDSSRVAAAMVLALALGRAHKSAAAVEVLDRAASLLDPTHDELARRVEAAAVGVALIDAETAPAITRRRDALLRCAAERGPAPPELLAVAAFAAVLTNHSVAVATEFAQRALAAGEEALAGRGDRPWYAHATWFSQVTVSLVWAECDEQVGPLLDASIAAARATGDSGRFAVGLAHRGWVALRRGDLAAAEADTRTALAADALPAPTFYRVLNAGILIDTLVERGDLDEAEAVLGPVDAEAESGSLTAAMLRYSRGRLRAAQGRTRDGLADLMEVGEFMTRCNVTCPGYVPWRSEAATVLIALGEQDAARRLAEEELQLAQAFMAPRAIGVALRVAGLVAGGNRGEAQLRDAVERFAQSGSGLLRAHALTDLGALLRRGNRRREAREYLREALDVAHRAGARPLAARAETELRATGARPRRLVVGGVDSLTASERRVAELAGDGLTNREIAQSLFVTARTVEGHLTSVFRKLGLDSREQLAGAMTG